MNIEDKVTTYIQELMSKKVGSQIGMSPEWAADALIKSHKQQGKLLSDVKKNQEEIRSLSWWRKLILRTIGKGLVRF